MNEALEILLPSLFIDLRLNRIEAATLKNNVASRGLLEKIGFVREGICRSYLKINGKWQDHILYSLLSDDYKRKFKQNQSNLKT